MTRARLTAVVVLAALTALVPAAAVSSPLPIPALPTDLLTEPFTGSPATAQPLPHEPIGQNPHLSANGTNSMHDDAYASDAYEVSGPARPRDDGAHRRRTASRSARPWPSTPADGSSGCAATSPASSYG